ncbi:thioredoxin-disulfide reductase [Limosilactobacillus fastidiosus]|uniref:Thioredoxin reductase n=1 Tax=Limosilactobacillus fastidiosus TaxID=2759855 RepID=A0A7W3U050_9LACO|nr:thioredoxin-disulfide reductase [Limosilactobacillus fastidiosus]MBB1062972.1 thioredoxin-disulfide reductase [Limosilactobacillus fastidiosus]MBB1086215.1 thioredoxin-disulfide reductase [Limosilactobacillus fastidiosus]MCD7084551.1 thioredoxin-disulfide reductase [Limosilactobacillus fastidiosus]MCD7086512.1 thioredoxin-disulfide reductase [Limosilactobacillus fastidiosus]MCD7114953.1 thioredoxin-disulfide reductase [Limosilactobacillus fastidiosus]
MKKYDVVVIGAGPGGMTAALYAARANLKVAMLDRGVYGGQMNNTDDIENYPGFTSIKGPELGEKMYQSATNSGVEFVYGNVQKVTVDDEHLKHVQTDSDELVSKAVIIATGSTNRKLGVPGEEEFSGKGVSYCAVCDGAFFKDRDVSVIGGGDSAISEGLYLANLADNVNVVHHRDKLRAQRVLQERAFDNDKMDFTWDSDVKEIIGDENQVTGIKVHNKKTDQDEVVPTSGVFIYVGNIPNSQAFTNLKITDEAGWIKTNDEMETTIPGIYAVGDVRQKKLRQITTAVGDGGIAGQNAFEYVEQFN